MNISIIGLTEYENLGDQFIGKTVDYLVNQYTTGGVSTRLIFPWIKRRALQHFGCGYSEK